MTRKTWPCRLAPSKEGASFVLGRRAGAGVAPARPQAVERGETPSAPALRPLPTVGAGPSSFGEAALQQQGLRYWFGNHYRTRIPRAVMRQQQSGDMGGMRARAAGARPPLTLSILRQFRRTPMSASLAAYMIAADELRQFRPRRTESEIRKSNGIMNATNGANIQRHKRGTTEGEQNKPLMLGVRCWKGGMRPAP